MQIVLAVLFAFKGGGAIGLWNCYSRMILHPIQGLLI